MKGNEKRKKKRGPPVSPKVGPYHGHNSPIWFAYYFRNQITLYLPLHSLREKKNFAEIICKNDIASDGKTIHFSR
jgi:hypothetical protein